MDSKVDLVALVDVIVLFGLGISLSFISKLFVLTAIHGGGFVRPINSAADTSGLKGPIVLGSSVVCFSLLLCSDILLSAGRLSALDSVVVTVDSSASGVGVVGEAGIGCQANLLSSTF